MELQHPSFSPQHEDKKTGGLDLPDVASTAGRLSSESLPVSAGHLLLQAVVDTIAGVTIETEQAWTFLAGGGEMGERIRSLDWSTTAFGPVDDWPQSLRTTIGMMLPSKAQIVLFWGPEFAVVYNDAYRPVFGAKHPAVLGQPGRVAWSEVWDAQANLYELLAGVVRTGEAFAAKDLLFVLERHGFAEETYFDVSYDPVRVESGDVGGVYCIVSETTGRVVGERRLALLRDLAARNASARSAHEACVLTMGTLATKRADIQFALVFLDGVVEAATPGAEAAYAAADPSLVSEITIGPRRFTVGINPQQPFDDQYRSFIDLVAGQLATAITNAQAYDDERKQLEALAAIDRAKTAFFSNVSHEFRTPLTLMLGPVEDSLADEDQPLPPKQRERQEMIRRNALRLLKMVNALLDFSRIEAHRVDAVYERTDLAAYTAELASTFRSLIERAGLRFVVDVSPVEEWAWVDRQMWEKIVLNLLSNAYKFTLEGEISVSLRAVGDQIELEVRDTGSGIPADELPHIFERFHRVESTRGRTQEGTGIGLALVRELVKLHHGDISVESTVSPSTGTAFRVRIPRGSAQLSTEPKRGPERLDGASEASRAYVEEAVRWLPADSDTSATQRRTDRGAGSSTATQRAIGARILLADDNADMREYVTRLLTPDFAVEAVADGRAALASVRAQLPDLVLADVMMPALDGYGLLKALREDPVTREVPIVLLSARAGEEARVEGMRAGADDYLVKPFSARELLARVGAHVQMARMRRASGERERALRQAAEDANRVKATFLATMSHELRTPLNAILGYTDLLDAEVAGSLTDGQKSQLQRIHLASRHLLKMIEEILSFSRIEAGREEVHLETIDVAELAVETCRLVEPLAVQKSLTFDYDGPTERLFIKSDGGKVRQILLNLLSNAIKFTERGGVSVRVTDEGQEVSLEVRDSGVGIAPDQLDRIFEPFRQATSTGPRRHGGTGLGLTVSRELARLLGGDISVASVPHHGSTFTFRVPAGER
jgi:signal transduction histidine kinase